MNDSFRIVQISDLHFGDLRFDRLLLNVALKEINKLNADLLVVAGDLTASGYEDQFLAAKKYIDKIKSRYRVIIAGNHDCQNVGYEYFEKIFGKRYADMDIPTSFGKLIRVVAVDSNKPDMNDGEIGREKYKYISEGFEDSQIKIFVLHHHLVPVPSTGRERNIVWDAGDVLAELAEKKVNLVLSGHKHVPYIWKIDGMNILTSGTLCTRRTRGLAEPSYNIIDISKDEIRVTVKLTGKNKKKEEVLS